MILFFGEHLFPHSDLVIYIVKILLIVAVIVLERKNPEATLAWVLVLAFLPIVGTVLYIIFSQNIARKTVFKMTPEEEYVASNSLRHQMEKLSSDSFIFQNPATFAWRDLVRLNQKYDRAYLTSGNRVEILPSGYDKFVRMVADIDKAQSSINIEYFIVKWDEMGQSLIEVLAKKAREGVKVRLLMDGLGSRQLTPKRRIQPLIDAGGSVEFFYQPRLKNVLLRLNYRNHRKLVIIDEKIGYIGGYNIANEYIGQKEYFGNWRDTHIRVEGNAVKDIYGRFILDWRFVSNERIDLAAMLAKDNGSPGNTDMQIISSGPDEYKEEIKRAYMKMITSATKSIYLQTPYFVPDASIHESLKMAALSGVDVRVMIPCKPDHPFVYWATLWYVGELLRSGVKVYIYDNGFLHAKTIVCDGRVASVGSANFDNRSFRLNFEANAIMYDDEVAGKMMRLFETDMLDSHEYTKALYESRTFLIKLKEAVSRLLTSIL